MAHVTTFRASPTFVCFHATRLAFPNHHHRHTHHPTSVTFTTQPLSLYSSYYIYQHPQYTNNPIPNMDHPQTPRVLQPHLSQFQHRIVRVLGKVVQLRGENAIIDAGGQIDVVLNRVRCNYFSVLHLHPLTPQLWISFIKA